MSTEQEHTDPHDGGEFLSDTAQFTAVLDTDVETFLNMTESCSEKQLQNMIRILENQLENTDRLHPDYTDEVANYTAKRCIAATRFAESRQKEKQY